jgi:hypothetical protein
MAVNFESLCKFHFVEMAEEQSFLSLNHTTMGVDKSLLTAQSWIVYKLMS